MDVVNLTYDEIIKPVYEDIKSDLKLLGVSDRNRRWYNYTYILDVMYGIKEGVTDVVKEVIEETYDKHKDWFDSKRDTYMDIRMEGKEGVRCEEGTVLVDNGIAIDKDRMLKISYVTMHVEAEVDDYRLMKLVGMLASMDIAHPEMMCMLQYGNGIDVYMLDMSKKPVPRNMVVASLSRALYVGLLEDENKTE